MNGKSRSSDFDSLIRALPKSDLHVHLDGSLRLSTLIELAKERGLQLPSDTEEGMRTLVFKPSYANLSEYLEGFQYTVAALQTAEALERATYELAEDCRDEGVYYLEVRFAPQLHVSPSLSLADAVRAVVRGIQRAEREFNAVPAVTNGEVPPFKAGVVVCAMRFFTRAFSKGYQWYFDTCAFSPQEEVFARASLDLARAAASLKNDEGLPVSGIDLAGHESGYPAETHREAFQVAHEAFLGKTVHAGEDYGPESIFQAIGDLHADRIGHGTWLFDASRVTDDAVPDARAYVDRLSQYIADRRITMEVCLTSNQQTVPDLAGDLSKHPFGEMVRRRLSTTLCTDNRLVSNTTVTREVQRAVETFHLDVKQLRDILTYGFKRSFFPGPYIDKRAYVRRVLDVMDRVVDDWQQGKLEPAGSAARNAQGR